MRPLVGLFVGGAGARMGGVAKGLLAHPDGATLLDRWLSLFASQALTFTLVGAHSAYPRHLPMLADDPPGIGPLGGLRALCRAAPAVVALACDMPFVTEALLATLVASSGTVVPRRGGRWEPLFARYESARAMPLIDARIAARTYALQGLCDDLKAQPLALDVPSALDDWDAPEDVSRPR